MTALWFLAGFAGVGYGVTGLVLRWLQARQILDRPNDRSSHTIPTPRGGGLAVTPLILLGWAGWLVTTGTTLCDSLALGAAAGLALISWIDDRRTLSALPRFAAQIATVAAVLIFMPPSQITGGFLPSAAEKVILGLAWVWFINLYNFMDGIDGITGTETLVIVCGLAIALPGLLPAVPLAIIAGTLLGFLAWNWHPAKVFLGDVGSIPLGFLLGYQLLTATSQHPMGWMVALIVPAYYWADATFTLGRRAFTGQTIWQAHREHLYQRATQGGWSHARVSLLIGLLGAVLVAMAWLSTHGMPISAMAGSLVAVALICGLFHLRGAYPDTKSY